MPHPARSPRMSLFAEHSLNTDIPPPYAPISPKQAKFAVKTSDGTQPQQQAVTIQIGGGNGKNDSALSPRRAARRSMQPRKSILKSNSAQSLATDENDTIQFPIQEPVHGHTIAFSTNLHTAAGSDQTGTFNFGNERDTRQSLARRVSFAASAHVRMFNPAIKDQATKDAKPRPKRMSFLEPSKQTNVQASLPAQSRRQSIQNIVTIQGNSKQTSGLPPHLYIAQGEAQGEMSMELDTESEHDSEEEGAEGDSGVYGTHPGDITGAAPGFGLDDDAEGEEDEEVDMDETSVYGGILRRNSVAPQLNQPVNPDESYTTDPEMDLSMVSSTATDEEKTMDFTVAIGGVLPRSPPVGAANNRMSIGYSMPVSPNSQANRFHPGDHVEGYDEGEGMVDMDETVAIGGIINGDDTLSSMGSEVGEVIRERTMTFNFGDVRAAANGAEEQEEEDGNVSVGMEMTMAMGGILQTNYPPLSPNRSTSAPSITRPIGGTPSFARPTLSSSQRSNTRNSMAAPETSPPRRISPVKRNVFAPSPSPFKSTPRKVNGMEVASEVAKRLSFGPPTSSGGNGQKRTRDEEELSQTSAKKRAIPTSMDGVFSTSPSHPPPEPTPIRQNTSTPSRQNPPTPSRQNPPTPSRQHPPTPMRGNIPKSPGKSPALRRMLGEQDVRLEWDDAEGMGSPQRISLGTFLSMAGVEFMESLPGVRRRSSVGRGVLSGGYTGDREYGLDAYAEARILGLYKNLYDWATHKLQSDIQASHLDLLKTEEDCTTLNPPVIKEYLSASDEDKALFEMTFKSFKRNTQLKARGRWYEWRMGVVGGLKGDVEGVVLGMREDEERLNSVLEQSQDVLPELQRRKMELQAELAREREEVRLIEECNQEELADLKSEMAEQSGQVEMYTAESNELGGKLGVLKAKLEELERKKGEHVLAISLAKSRCDQFTRSDVARLNEEYKSLQNIHQWTPNHIRPEQMALTFDEEIHLIIPCSDYTPSYAEVKVELLQKSHKSSEKSRYPREATLGLFGLFESAVSGLRHSKGMKLSSFVQGVGQLWSAAQRLRSEISILNLRYPLTYDFASSASELVVQATVLLPEVRAKTVVRFGMGENVLRDWPKGLKGVEVGVNVVYGQADAESMVTAVKDVMSAVRNEGYLGALLQACLNAAETYVA